MSATLDQSKLQLADLTMPSSGTVDGAFLRNLAMLLACGQSQHAIAQHLQVPLNRIAKFVAMAEFSGYMTTVQQNVDDADLAEKLLRGTAVDSVLVLTRLRDDPRTKPDLVCRICMFLLKENIGANKLGLLAKESGDMLADELRKGRNPADALENEIRRLLSDDPEAKRLVEMMDKGYVASRGEAPPTKDTSSVSSPAVSNVLPDTTEPSRRGLHKPGRCVDAPGSVSSTVGKCPDVSGLAS